MALPQERAEEIAKAFAAGERHHYLPSLRLEVGTVKYLGELVMWEQDGLTWMQFPAVHKAAYITTRAVLNGLIRGLGKSYLKRYMFGVSYAHDITFSHRASVKSNYTHRRVGVNEPLPMADGDLSALLCQNMMAIGNTTTVGVT